MTAKLGIFNGFRTGTDSHELYVAACEELNVDYEVIDIVSEKWLENVLASDCDAFLVRPTPMYVAWKRMYDEKLYHLVHTLGKTIYPRYPDLLMYENKRHMAYTMQIHGIPTAKTHVFYDQKEAIRFVENAPMPLVFKTHIGAQGRGVKILKNRKEALSLINRVFRWGYFRHVKTTVKGLFPQKISVPYYFAEPEYKTAILQEFLPDALEWRMIRIGDSYFGHQKLKKGDFHSGSCLVGWIEPPERLLRFTKQVCDVIGTTSMCVDIFETPDGEYFVNELQAVFGSYDNSQMYIDGRPGRLLYLPDEDRWKFEEGYFNRNGSCNLRVQHLVEMIAATNEHEVALENWTSERA